VTYITYYSSLLYTITIHLFLGILAAPTMMSYVVEKMAKIQVTDHANQATTLGRNFVSALGSLKKTL